MIVANIRDAKRYFGVLPEFKEIFEKLSELTPDSPTGATEYDGFRIGVSAGATYDVKPDDGTPREFEAHRKFLDIHYVIDGVECMGYADIDTLTPTTEYNDEKDYQMLKGHVNKVILNKGDFCVVFPEDAHLPQMIGDDGKWVKKAVVKMKV